VFDIGGVLLDWDPRYLFDQLIADNAEREWFLTEVCSPEWNHRQDEGRGWDEAVAEAIARHPGYAAWIRAYDERWIETIAGLYEDTMAVIDELQSSSVGVYALTNFSAQKWPVACRNYPQLQAFDGAVVSGAEGVAKPNPKIYRLLLDRFDLDPGRTYFVDDRYENVAAARAVGIDS